jgi:hypothetical protein
MDGDNNFSNSQSANMPWIYGPLERTAQQLTTTALFNAVDEFMGASGHVRDHAREIYGDYVIDAGLERIAKVAHAIFLQLVVHRVDLVVRSQQWSQAAFLVGTDVPRGMLDVIASGPVPGCSDEYARFSAVLGEALNRAKQESILQCRPGLNLRSCPPSPVSTRQVRRKANGERRALGLPRSSVDPCPQQLVLRIRKRATRHALGEFASPDSRPARQVPIVRFAQGHEHEVNEWSVFGTGCLAFSRGHRNSMCCANHGCCDHCANSSANASSTSMFGCIHAISAVASLKGRWSSSPGPGFCSSLPPLPSPLP